MKDLEHLRLHGYQITVHEYDGKQQCDRDHVSGAGVKHLQSTNLRIP